MNAAVARNAIQDKLEGWEASWAMYDEATYRDVLAHICINDIVYEIGAGICAWRSAWRQLQKCSRSRDSKVLAGSGHWLQRCTPSKPAHLSWDARAMPAPSGTTVGVLLMRHCTHFQLYAQKLKEAGAQALITNARWKLGVERVLSRRNAFPSKISRWDGMPAGAGRWF